jgi:integrase
MASIHRRHKSKYWQCEFCDASGKWRRVSTRLENKAAATKWCLAMQAAADRIRGGSATEQQMRRLISEQMKAITGKGLAEATVRSWFNQWLTAKQGTVSDATYERYKQALEAFLEFLGERAERPMELLQSQDIVDYRNSLRARGVSPPTVNLLVSKIVSAPLRAARQGIIERNPAAGLQRLLDRGKQRKLPFSIEETRKLLTVASNEWRGMILCAYSTGMRLGDVASLKWADIDFDNNVICFEQHKTAQATVVGLHADFQDWLDQQTVKAGPVFPSLIGRGSSGKGGLSFQFADLMKRAGVKPEVIRTKSGGGRRVFSKSFHSFRHHAASAIFKSKLIEQTQRAVTGHASSENVRRYTHIDLEAIRAAASLIPRIF